MVVQTPANRKERRSHRDKSRTTLTRRSKGSDPDYLAHPHVHTLVQTGPTAGAHTSTPSRPGITPHSWSPLQPRPYATLKTHATYGVGRSSTLGEEGRWRKRPTSATDWDTSPSTPTGIHPPAGVTQPPLRTMHTGPTVANTKAGSSFHTHTRPPTIHHSP